MMKIFRSLDASLAFKVNGLRKIVMRSLYKATREATASIRLKSGGKYYMVFTFETENIKDDNEEMKLRQYIRRQESNAEKRINVLGRHINRIRMSLEIDHSNFWYITTHQDLNENQTTLRFRQPSARTIRSGLEPLQFRDKIWKRSADQPDLLDSEDQFSFLPVSTSSHSLERVSVPSMRECREANGSLLMSTASLNSAPSTRLQHHFSRPSNPPRLIRFCYLAHSAFGIMDAYRPRFTVPPSGVGGNTAVNAPYWPPHLVPPASTNIGDFAVRANFVNQQLQGDSPQFLINLAGYPE
ncbi:hypothetical protein R3P38DRAFT_2809042 [Favolaschia claudopus]|uniref:Uncharacterized protein n=1 Tax=Favolaschia claudopus TaxID=2862362 RepID=A0AAV9ZEF7_9AGAR